MRQLPLFVILLALAVGCTSPSRSKSTVEPYPSPTSRSVVTTSTTGAIVGILKVKQGASEVPVSNARLYLGEILQDTRGQERAASFDRLSSPTTVTDESGQFAFSEIEPGRYTLILDTIINSYLLFEPGKTEALIITVEAGKVTDIGTLVYEKLPVSAAED